MRLARKFTFICESNNDIVYTAEEDNDGSYIITWDWPEASRIHLSDVDSMTTYEASTVSQNIINANWRVQEVLIGPMPDESSLRYVGKTIVSTVGSPYELEAHESGKKYVLVGSRGIRHDHGYTDEILERNVEVNGWQWLDETPLEPSGDDGAAWPFLAKTYVVESVNIVEPPVWTEIGEITDFDSALSAEWIPDYGITLADIRRFVQENPEVSVEVEADYFVVNALDNPGLRFLAKTEEELTALFQAIRTLNKAWDRG